MHIAIIGCGSTGLAAAAFLHDAGHQVTLLEQFAAPRPLGAGLLLQQTGLAVLARLGLDQKIRALGQPIYGLDGRTAAGRRIFALDYRQLAPQAFGLGVQRGALFGVLYKAVLARSLIPLTAQAVTETLCDAAGRWLSDAAGNSHGPFDLVVDASGARSPLRNRYGALRLNRPYPYGAVWGLARDPEQRFGGHVLQQRYDKARVMIGLLPVGRLPEQDEACLTFFWSLPVRDFAAWGAGDFSAWQRRVAQLWPEAEPLVRQFRNHGDLVYASYGDVVLRRWHEERLVFIGDAGHCMSPQLGQGANLGLLDAITLRDCLDRYPDPAQALPAFSRLRRRHIRFYQWASRRLTPFFQSDNDAAAWLRDMSFAPLAQLPFVHRYMLTTLAGIRTGFFSCCDPGQWHPDYALRAPRANRDS